MDSVLVETPTAPLARAPARPAPELSVIVPTFNERANIPLLVARLQRTLEGADWEVIFVDVARPWGGDGPPMSRSHIPRPDVSQSPE